ncbi:methylenetetrahydrofolate dehydrogenase (NADP+)/methenyltetrahydrofolate cyclohydrolase [Lachnospiraceae bacterium PFB1-21]
MSTLMKGMEVAKAMKEGLYTQAGELKAKGVTPTLAIVRVGESPDDMAYERGAIKRCEGAGVAIRVCAFPKDVEKGEFESAFLELNEDPEVHGILVFQPLPKQLDEDFVKANINPLKDVDGMCTTNMGKVFSGDHTGYAPCTAEGAVLLLKHYGIQIAGKNVVVLGRSTVVGKPLSILLLEENATVTICHSKTTDLDQVLRRADILVVAVGVAHLVKASMIKEGAVVVDVGINVDAEGKLIGDVDFDQVEPKASFISPVPGGAGSVTTSVLASHTIQAAKALS